MPERRFDTGYWNDPDIMKLPMKAKLLYLYLWTNRHCNQAGVYEIALETIKFETDLELDEIPDLLQLLNKKVAWYPEQNLVWVKNFLHRQSQSPKFLAAAAKCLKNISNNGLVVEVVEYNKRYTLSIPYQYPIDTLPIPPYSSSLSYADSHASSLSEGGGLGEGVELSAADQEIIVVWRGVKNFNMDMAAIVELLATLKKDFPDVDILDESRKWAARKISEPLVPTSRPSGQIYNFMQKKHLWNQERKGRGKRKGIHDFPEVRCKCGYTGPDVGHKICPICHEPYERQES